MYGFAACIFAVSAFMNLFATLMQSAKKKKQCASLVFFVEVVSCVTYSSLFFKAFPDMRNVDGNPFDWLHLFQWGFTTPAMLIILSGLGSSMEEQYINNWPLTRKAVIIVECVLMCGAASLVYTGPLRFIFLFCAISGYLFLCRTIGEIMHFAIENAGTALEVQTLVVLKWTTYGLWSVFGILQSLEHFGVVDRIEHRTVRTALDVLVKILYSIILLSSNIFILDIVADVRMIQLREDASRKESTSKRTQMVNRALQLACMEAEAKSRLSRRFVCNMSHELRTPLNSIIAFNTLLMESGLSSEHKEFLRTSLSSAEDLLHIITQLLDYVRLESADEGPVDGPTHAPFYLGGMVD
eukprot:CAMPEP_0172176998 /NCGR_PEP_ID=MMETSP1050-20130122/15166_1 /TAXON_ID=233186 /ORGANISM="Cryptomonas curvata, Strain CCAP979/52" /LENGTH=353 /DNA_ID=CAMNT_0012849417 /DNA_START=486 /DNA_END=1544 /DNA_ORIENTATION=+